MRLVRRRGDATPDFDAFCRGMLPRITTFAFRVTGNWQDAEDVAIETLARALVRWPRLAEASWRERWVLRVAANLAIDVLRKRRTVPIGDELPNQVALPKEDAVELVDVLAHLPRRQREVLVLRYFEDLPYGEIADRLDLSAGSVKTHLHRGVRSLRQLFGSADSEEASP